MLKASLSSRSMLKTQCLHVGYVCIVCRFFFGYRMIHFQCKLATNKCVCDSISDVTHQAAWVRDGNMDRCAYKPFTCYPHLSLIPFCHSISLPSLCYSSQINVWWGSPHVLSCNNILWICPRDYVTHHSVTSTSDFTSYGLTNIFSSAETGEGNSGGIFIT